MNGRAIVHIQFGDRSPAQLREALAGWDLDIEFVSRAPTIEEIVAYVARRLDLTCSQIAGACRTSRLSTARAAVCWFAYRFTGRSYAAIARQLGVRDHSAVYSGVRRAERFRRHDEAFLALTDGLVEHFGYEAEA
jgi:chromosomal replication initiation ATPase DnaA